MGVFLNSHFTASWWGAARTEYSPLQYQPHRLFRLGELLAFLVQPVVLFRVYLVLGLGLATLKLPVDAFQVVLKGNGLPAPGGHNCRRVRVWVSRCTQVDRYL